MLACPLPMDLIASTDLALRVLRLLRGGHDDLVSTLSIHTHCHQP